MRYLSPTIIIPILEWGSCRVVPAFAAARQCHNQAQRTARRVQSLIDKNLHFLTAKVNCFCVCRVKSTVETSRGWNHTCLDGDIALARVKMSILAPLQFTSHPAKTENVPICHSPRTWALANQFERYEREKIVNLDFYWLWDNGAKKKWVCS